MPDFEFVRRPPQWLRIALAALLFGFALNSMAHAAHQHDASAGAAVHGVLCGYCVSYGGMADAPQHTYAPADAAPAAPPFDLPPFSARSKAPRRCAQPRAPPLT